MPAALAYAEQHASGYNVEAGKDRSQIGNPEGAARLCRWALTRKVDKGRACPVCEVRADGCICDFTPFAHERRRSMQDPPEVCTAMPYLNPHWPQS